MTRLLHLTLCLIILALVAACSPAQSAPTPTATATPTPFPTFAFVQYTTVPQVAAAATAAAESAAAGDFQLDAQKVERGLGRWEALECGSCHGTVGEGSDDGPALTDYTADEAAFVDFLRTGGSVGNSHRYPAESLSNSGISNLYHYVRSLGE